MHSNSNDRLIGVLESTRELLRDVENKTTVPCEIGLEVRLRLDREIEHLRSADAA
jgi:hypothetical protein